MWVWACMFRLWYVFQVLSLTYQLEHQYVGLGVAQLMDIRQLRLRAQTLQLLALLRVNTHGSKAACIQYLQIINQLERYACG